VNTWRSARYPCADYPAIGEILEYAVLPESDHLRFLRRPQLRALETYWYLRLVENTPGFPISTPVIFRSRANDSRRSGSPYRTSAFLRFCSMAAGRRRLSNGFLPTTLSPRELKLESLRETLTLDYPSYIFALAMGAGKTILIGPSSPRNLPWRWSIPTGPSSRTPWSSPPARRFSKP